MEHRNSTVITSRGTLADSRIDLLGTVSHEFIHAWNVERIRPRTLEPFNFEDANVSGELWLAEGVTSYYDDLLMARAGLIELPALLSDLTAVVSLVSLSPATRFRIRGRHEPAWRPLWTPQAGPIAPTGPTPSSPTTSTAPRSAWGSTSRSARRPATPSRSTT